MKSEGYFRGGSLGSEMVPALSRGIELSSIYSILSFYGLLPTLIYVPDDSTVENALHDDFKLKRLLEMKDSRIFININNY